MEGPGDLLQEPVPGLTAVCVRVGAMRCRSQAALTTWLTVECPLTDTSLISHANPLLGLGCSIAGGKR